MRVEREFHAKVVDTFIVNWVGKYVGVKPERVISVGLADNPHRWVAVCSKCPIRHGHVGPTVHFPAIDLRYLFTVGDNEAIPKVQYGILVGQCPYCKHVYFAKGVIR